MYKIIIQFGVDKTEAPKSSLMRHWAKKILASRISAAEITIRIADVFEMTTLNRTFRRKDKPTNVLSFPCDLPEHIKMKTPPLGDIVICPDVVNREAMEQGKTPEAHWAHMIVHGIFHLLGYDHEIDSEAEVMESLEIQTMAMLGFANPYDVRDETSHD